jgi:hypothetical protein
VKKFGTYKILYDKPLIMEYYSGLISNEDFIHFKNIIKKEPNYTFYSNTILDLRDCHVQIDIEDLNKILDFMKSSFEKKENRTVAYLTSEPNETILATLYSVLAEKSDLNFKPNVFSSIKPVIRLFGEEIITENEYIGIIDELKTSPNNVFTKKV